MTPQDNIPYGFCHCGCGQKTTIPKYSGKHGKYEYIKGVPVKFTKHHSKNKPKNSFMDAAPFKIRGVYCRFILLSKGQIAIVYESDYLWIAQWKWHVSWDAGTRSYYAARSTTLQERLEGKGVTVSMHRAIMGLDRGDPREVDHVESGDTLDNRRSNLRIASRTQNMRNRRANRRTKANLKGVSWHSRDLIWCAAIRVNKKLVHIGNFHDKQVAHAAYQEAAKKYFKEFARFA